MPYSLILNILLIGAIQGFIFSGFAFFSKKYKSKSNFFLALLIIAFSYNIFQHFLIHSKFIEIGKYFESIYLPLSSVYMVIFYFYVKTFLYPSKKVNKTDYLLFIPFFFALFVSSIEKLGFFIGLFDISDNIFFNYFRVIYEAFSCVFSFVLIMIVHHKILKFEKEQILNQSKAPKIIIKWLKYITIVFLILCIYWILPVVYTFVFKRDGISLLFILWIGLAITIYVLGHIGLYQYGVVQQQKSIRNYSNNQTIAIRVEVENSKNENVEAFENYIKIEKNYQNPDLSLELVADELGINKSYLSRIINNEIGKSFTDYVNEMRVEEAKIYLANPDFKNYTLLAIGLEAGFNSKSVFNAAFKKFTGMTPSEFRNSLK